MRQQRELTIPNQAPAGFEWLVVVPFTAVSGSWERRDHLPEAVAAAHRRALSDFGLKKNYPLKFNAFLVKAGGWKLDTGVVSHDDGTPIELEVVGETIPRGKTSRGAQQGYVLAGVYTLAGEGAA